MQEIGDPFCRGRIDCGDKLKMKTNTNEMVVGQAAKHGHERSNSVTGTAFAGRPSLPRKNGELVSTKDVIAHHLKCFGELNLEGVLSDYAADAIMFTANGALQGVGEIRPLFQAMLAEFAKPGATFQMKQQFIQGDHAYILWNAETADNVYELGTDTFAVREGRIVAQSYTSKIAPKH